jgi:tRNA(Ile)-lysidine synthase
MPGALLTQVRQTITTHQLLPPRARVVVAVSGGTDSVALLHVLTALQTDRKLTLHIAHLDHGLREESHQDAEFVRGLGAGWRIPTTVERRDVSATCARESWSLEDGARRIRYQFLLEVARRQSASYIALAHTADDQAETVLMRLVRGTGLMGLSAIPIKRRLDEVWVVRPLLETWRRDIIAYLEQAHLVYREDATNKDSRFVRNRIRHELLPLLERVYNPNIKGALTQLAEQSRWDYAYLQEAAARQWKRTVKVQPYAPMPGYLSTASRKQGGRPAPSRGAASEAQVAIAIPVFLRQPKALQRQLVRQAIQRVRGHVGELEFRHWLETERLFLERPVGTLLDLPGGVQLRREKQHVICRLAARAPQSSLLD